jgi:hypothetical protein
MKDIRTITTPSERNAIDSHISLANERIRNYERQRESFKIAEENHKAFLKQQEELLKDFEDRVKEYKKRIKEFPFTVPFIMKSMRSVTGIKQLERVWPKDAEAQAALEFFKQYIPTRLLTQGKISATGKVHSLHEILHDIDKRAMIEHTLGKKKTQDLLEIVDRFKEAEESADMMEAFDNANKAAIKGIVDFGKLIPFLRGNIATGEVIVNMIKKFGPAVKKADYSKIDMNLISDIVDNKDNIIQPRK